MLKKINIEGLFNKFNYDIELNETGLTVLTGPNGYGKTTILKIIYAFAMKNIAFFFQLPFKKINLTLENNEIRLSKTNGAFEIHSGSEAPIYYKKSEIISREMKRYLEESPYRQIDENHWLDRRTDTNYTTEEVLEVLEQITPGIQARFIKKNMPDFVEVYLIREQRLLRKITTSRRRNFRAYYEDETRQNFSATIEEYANELAKKIKEILASASQIGQELDSSFPRRLFDETNQVSEAEFDKRYNIIKDKQQSLSTYGLSAINKDSHPSYKNENAKALLVYLNDTEKKLAIFDGILKKLDIFSTILNERQFVLKKLEISPEFGFRFITIDGKVLSLTDLSSGEQQEVVLLYELLFKVTPNTLVLIDEPEISLHVAWQKEVLNDFLKIIQLQKISVIAATHSPQIIGTYWDLVVDLEEIRK